MEGSFRLLLVAGLLAALLPGVFWPQSGAPCEPALLATHVLLFCGGDMARPECCEVLAAVDLGGGVPCLCRVAAEPQLVMAGLNATHLLTLYTSCGGLRPGGAHLAAACEDEAYPTHPSSHELSKHYDCDSPPKAQFGDTLPTHCGAQSEGRLLASSRSSMCEDSSILARDLMSYCRDTEEFPSRPCCRQVLGIVDDGCLCVVGEEPRIITSILDTVHMWFLYECCGGKSQIPSDRTSCTVQQASPPPPPSSPPPPSIPPPSPPSPVSSTQSIPSYSDILEALRSLSVISFCLGIGVIAFAILSITAAAVIWRRSRNSSVAPVSNPLEQKVFAPVSSTPTSWSVPCTQTPVSSMPTSSSVPCTKLEMVSSRSSLCPPVVCSKGKVTHAPPPRGEVLPPPSLTPSAPPVELMVE